MDNEHLEMLAEVNQRSKSNTKRLDEHDRKIEALEKTYSIMEKMDYRMGKVENTVERINTKLDSANSEKSKKWDKLVDYIFYAVVAVLLSLLFIKLGLK